MEHLELRDQPIYQDDWIGLRKLDEQGSLHFLVAEGEHVHGGAGLTYRCKSPRTLSKSSWPPGLDNERNKDPIGFTVLIIDWSKREAFCDWLTLTMKQFAVILIFTYCFAAVYGVLPGTI